MEKKSHFDKWCTSHAKTSLNPDLVELLKMNPGWAKDLTAKHRTTSFWRQHRRKRFENDLSTRETKNAIHKGISKLNFIRISHFWSGVWHGGWTATWETYSPYFGAHGVNVYFCSSSQLPAHMNPRRRGDGWSSWVPGFGPAWDAAGSWVVK